MIHDSQHFTSGCRERPCNQERTGDTMSGHGGTRRWTDRAEPTRSAGMSSSVLLPLLLGRGPPLFTPSFDWALPWGKSWSQPVPSRSLLVGQVGHTWSEACGKRLTGQTMAGASDPFYSQSQRPRLVPGGTKVTVAHWGKELLAQVTLARGRDEKGVWQELQLPVQVVWFLFSVLI